MRGNTGWVATSQNPGNLLEAMEKGAHKVQDAAGATSVGVESTRNG